jgi:ABC-type nitrate/sulfonate/bicarbonate transport system ATPase subunit
MKLRAEAVRHDFGATSALAPTTLEVGNGEFASIVGPSGCGKSTLFVDHYPHALSGGMRQRVALMRTLAFHKDVMLLDEPFGALDSQTRLRMQQWLLDVWADQARTILFITHDVDEAIFLSDRVHVMSARPGAIRASFDIGLPRPRSFELLTSDAFTDLKREILALIYSETLKQLEQEPDAA